MKSHADVLRHATIAAALSLIGMSAALAADMPDFNSRFVGAPAQAGWEGIVAGGQIGLTNFNVNFENIAIPSATLPLTGQQSTTGRQFGGFFGYNSQWDGVVLGAELGYNKGSGLSTSQSVTQIQGGVVTGVASGSITLNDYVTARVRAGYPIGQFLPYAFVGGAVGRFSYVVTNTANNNWSDSRSQAFALGLTTGVGVDVLILPNVFLRGEWEYNVFSNVAGMRTNTNTARAALGVKF
jgi:opacity protein-like surface antigen